MRVQSTVIWVVFALISGCSSTTHSDGGVDAVDQTSSDALLIDDIARDVQTDTRSDSGVDAAGDVPVFDTNIPDAALCFADRGHAPTATPDSDSGPWSQRATLDRSGGIIVESVVYVSGSLRIAGLVCRPDDVVAHPVIVSNHGGFQGLTTEWTATDSLCRSFARLGYVVMESSYRGEDGSDGQVEVCQGEVDDVINMLTIVRAQPYAMGARVAALGGSHGGCISARLAIRDSTLRAVVELYGPSDIVPLRQFWRDQIALNEPMPECATGIATCELIHQCLISIVESSLGGTPEQVPSEYARRSWVNDLANLHVPILIFQGTADLLVTSEQSCEVRAALSAIGHPPQAWYLDSALAPQNPSDVCGGNYRTDPVPDINTPSAWLASDQYFFVFEGQGHGFGGNAQDFFVRSAVSFIVSRL